MIQILDFVKQVGQLKLEAANIIVDATLGNGHDTLWMLQNAKTAKLYGFDIQQEAITQTKKRLEAAHIDISKSMFIHDSHSNLDHYVKEPIDLLMFNFGYLPGSDKTVMTQTKTSLIAIQKGLAQLAPRGVAILVVYPGHYEGEREAKAIEDEIKHLPWESYRVYCYQIMNNTKKPPKAYIIQKA